MIDDDGKLFRKFQKKRAVSKQQGIDFLLTFEEWVSLVKAAGLKSSDLGYSGNNYVLGRYGDVGPYSLTNSRFITAQQNVIERNVSDKMIRQGRKISKLGVAARKATALKRRAEFEAQAGWTKLNERNSQYGTFWITNGGVNRKWSPEKGPIPRGFRRGRSGLCRRLRINGVVAQLVEQRLDKAEAESSILSDTTSKSTGPVRVAAFITPELLIAVKGDPAPSGPRSSNGLRILPRSLVGARAKI